MIIGAGGAPGRRHGQTIRSLNVPGGNCARHDSRVGVSGISWVEDWATFGSFGLEIELKFLFFVDSSVREDMVIGWVVDGAVGSKEVKWVW